MLRTVVISVLSLGVAASAICQQAKSGTGKGSSPEEAAASATNKAGSGPTAGTSYSGSSANLQTSIPFTPAPQLQVIQPAQITAAPSAAIEVARPIGAGGGCSRKTSSECGMEAAVCLVNKGLNSNHTVDGLSYPPSIQQTSSRTEEQAMAAGDCSADLQRCLQPAC